MNLNFLKGIVLFFTFNTLSSVGDNFFLMSIPKCGTHLLVKCLEKITNKKRRYFFNDRMDLPSSGVFLDDFFVINHIDCSTENINIFRNYQNKAIFIYRDPRDQIVSSAFYMKEKPVLWPFVEHLSIEQIITLLILYPFLWAGPPGWRSDRLFSARGIDDFYNLWLGWLLEPNVYTTTFERLVGAKGGGDDESQIAEICNIASFLSIKISYEEGQSIGKYLFGGESTFFEGKAGTERQKGQIGAWKIYFSEDHKLLFKKNGGSLLVKLGYEKDLNW